MKFIFVLSFSLVANGSITINSNENGVKVSEIIGGASTFRSNVPYTIEGDFGKPRRFILEKNDFQSRDILFVNESVKKHNTKIVLNMDQLSLWSSQYQSNIISEKVEKYAITFLKFQYYVSQKLINEAEEELNKLKKMISSSSSIITIADGSLAYLKGERSKAHSLFNYVVKDKTNDPFVLKMANDLLRSLKLKDAK